MKDQQDEGWWDNLLAGWWGRDKEQSSTSLTTLSHCERVLCLTDRMPVPCDQQFDQPFLEDAINIRANQQRIANNQIRDTVLQTTLGMEKTLAQAAHRDAIQLIPTHPQLANYQFMAGALRDIIIEGNRIHSEGSLQGIFASDGLFENIIIRNNIIDTQSVHKITINGLLSGKIANNRDAAGNLLRIHLGPLRLGGNLATGNVWILSFAKEESVAYLPLSEIIPDSERIKGAQPYPHVQDERQLPQNRSAHVHDTNLYDFPLGLFREALQNTTIAMLLERQHDVAEKVVAWVGRLLGMQLPEKYVLDIINAYDTERQVAIAFIKNQALRNYFVQVLAKSLASLEDSRISQV